MTVADMTSVSGLEGYVAYAHAAHTLTSFFMPKTHERTSIRPTDHHLIHETLIRNILLISESTANMCILYIRWVGMRVDNK